MECHPYDDGPPMAETHMRLARDLGFKGPMPRPYCDMEAVPWPFSGRGPVALISDTCSSGIWARKRWPRYPQLACELVRHGWQVGLVGGPTEGGHFNPDGWPPEFLYLVGHYTVPQLAFLALRAEIFITNDSGPAHVAGAVGANTVVLFGPTNELVWKPLGERVRVIASTVDCRPCCGTDRWKRCYSGDGCMRAITVEQVMTAVREIMN